MVGVAAADAVLRFEVRRRQHLARRDEPRDAGRHALEGAHDQVLEAGPGRVRPAAVGEDPRHGLDDHAHHVAARRDERRVDQRRDRQLHDRRGGQAAVLRRVVGALHVVEPGRADEDAAAQAERRVVVGPGRREVRQLRQPQVHLRDAPRRADVARAPAQVRAELHGRQQVEQRPLRIETRRHDPRPELVARGERHARRPTVAGRDGRDLAPGPDLRPMPAGSRGERIRYRAGTAAREDRLAGGATVAASRVGEQDRGRAHREHAHGRVEDPARRDDGSDGLGLEPVGDVVGDRHRQDAQELARVVGSEPLEGAAQEQPREGVAEAGRLRVGRRGAGKRPEEGGEHPDLAVEGRPGARVGLRPGGKLSAGAGGIGPQRDRAMPLRREHPHGRRHERQPVAAEVEVADEGRPEATDGVEGARHAAPVGERPGLHLAAQRRPPLEDDGSEPGLREQRRRREPVVAAADDDGVVRRRGSRARHLRQPSSGSPSAARAPPAARSPP